MTDVRMPTLRTLQEWQQTHKKRQEKDYTFWCQFDEKPNTIPGCPGSTHNGVACKWNTNKAASSQTM